MSDSCSGRRVACDLVVACLLANGANGMSDIEGKVAREAMSECGQRASFKTFGADRRVKQSDTA
jgi:hypothetical protein